MDMSYGPDQREFEALYFAAHGDEMVEEMRSVLGGDHAMTKATEARVAEAKKAALPADVLQFNLDGDGINKEAAQRLKVREKLTFGCDT